MFKAVFFDLDETLVEAMQCHIEANKLVFEKFNIDYKEIENRTKSIDFLGMRMVDILKKMIDVMGINEKQLAIRKLTTQREKIFLKLVKEKAKLLPGAKEALTYVKNKRKVLGVSSSGTRKYIFTALKKFNLLKLVDFIVGEEDVSKGKPNPECYMKSYSLAEKMVSLKKDECLVVEDSPNGVIAAKKAGLRVCYVPKLKKNLLTAVDYQIKSLKEFTNIAL